MTALTVWKNDAGEVRLNQLSDDPADGTAQEQIGHLATLSFMEGFQCVSADYTGPVPEADAWRWDGKKITAIVPVPQSVTPRQVRLLLLQQGLLANVEAMIKAGDQATQITWEFASEFRRNDPLLEQLSKALGLTDAQVDGFFIAAASI